MDGEHSVGQSTARDGLPLDFKVGVTLMMIVLAAAVVVLALTEPKGETRTQTTTVITKTVADAALRHDVAALRKRDAKADAASARLRATGKALSARVDALASGLARVRRAPPPPPTPSGTGKLASRVGALAAQLETANRCLFQLQKQLDDLQAYALTRAALHRRVSGPCRAILKPRFAGG